MAAQGIDRHQRALDLQQIQERGDGRDFVGFGVHGHLTQGEALGRRPGADEVQRAEFGRPGAAQRLAVDGHVLDPQRRTDRPHPFLEAGLECPGVEAVEDALEGVVRRDAVGQGQEAAQPVAALAAEGLDLLPVLGTGDDRAQGDDDDVLQRMQAAVNSSRVLELGEVPRYRQIDLLCW